MEYPLKFGLNRSPKRPCVDTLRRVQRGRSFTLVNHCGVRSRSLADNRLTFTKEERRK